MVHIKKLCFFNFQKDFTLKTRSVDSYKDGENHTSFHYLPYLKKG